MRSPPATMPRRGEAGTLLWLCDCCNRGISRLQVLLLSNSVRDFPLRPPVLDKPMNLIEVRADGCICHRASDVWISCIRCNGSVYRRSKHRKPYDKCTRLLVLLSDSWACPILVDAVGNRERCC